MLTITKPQQKSMTPVAAKMNNYQSTPKVVYCLYCGEEQDRKSKDGCCPYCGEPLDDQHKH